MNKKEQIVLSLDQSTTATGWAVFTQEQLTDFGIYKPSGKREMRIYRTCEWLEDIIENQQETEIIVVLEDIQMQGNVETYKSLAQLQGSLITLLVKMKEDKAIKDYKIYYASEWKSSCGIKGRRRAEQKKSAQDFVLRKHNIVAEEDACDAICLGEHYLHTVNSVLNFE